LLSGEPSQPYDQTEFAPVSFLADQRDGEALSVRVAFYWDASGTELSLEPDDPWWELLEVLPYEDLHSG
jgi:hypothetical protein